MCYEFYNGPKKIFYYYNQCHYFYNKSNEEQFFKVHTDA